MLVGCCNSTVCLLANHDRFRLLDMIDRVWLIMQTILLQKSVITWPILWRQLGSTYWQVLAPFW